MGRMVRGTRGKARRGATLVEFAIVAPIFFLMVFAMVEFGRTIMVEQYITDAARDGARAAVLDGSTTSTVNGAVASSLAAVGLTGGTTTITPSDPSTVGIGQTVSVKVEVPVGANSWLPVPRFISGSAVLSATAAMRRETVK